MLRLYNTLTKQLEDVEKPTGRQLNLYSCGPTVYGPAHIGNLRSFVVADVLYRTLKLSGYDPRWVMNITDVDDKTIRGAIAAFGPRAGVAELKTFTDRYTQGFKDDLREVGVLVDEIDFRPVTGYIREIQGFVTELLEKGYAYRAEDGSTYFSIEAYQRDFGDYGNLVGGKFLEGKRVGARVKVDEYDKDNLSDFALWKARDEKDGDIYWDHPKLGPGRPGWHVECSVINRVAFGGEPTDIHTGGVDLIFPHHTNEIAQSQPLYRPFVNHWLHSEHLLVDGKKMSKSLGNFYTIEDLKKRFPDKNPIIGQAIRFLFLQGHYQIQQNFTEESFRAALTGLVGLTSRSRMGVSELERSALLQKLSDDLSTPQALSLVSKNSELIEKLGINLDLVNRYINPPNLNIFASDNVSVDSSVQIATRKPELSPSLYGASVTGPFWVNAEDAEKLKEMISQREVARAKKDFAKSDAIRKQIEQMGFELKDTPEGPQVSRKL